MVKKIPRGCVGQVKMALLVVRGEKHEKTPHE